MVNESFFSLMCATTIAFLFGLALCFAGYRLFIILLPIWGFFFGFGLGAQTIQAIFPSSTLLVDVTGWVVGLVVGVIFAVLSYLFYLFAVAILAGSIGYIITASIWLTLFNNFGFVAWLVAIVVGMVFAFVTIRFDLQKWVIEIGTAIAGAGVVFLTFMFLFNPVKLVLANPVAFTLQNSWLAFIVFIVLAACGAFFQARANAAAALPSYNRWGETESSM